MGKNFNVRAIVTEKLTAVGFVKNIGLGQVIDSVSDLLLGNALQLELVSSEFIPMLGTTTSIKELIEAKAKLNITINHEEDELKYVAKLQVDENFGQLGAILVTNVHHKEMYLKDIVLEGLPQGVIKVECKSWVHSVHDNPQKRIFFTNKAYLPSQTPVALKSLREKELEMLRGDGIGERKVYDRIYDYDAYNDLEERVGSFYVPRDEDFSDLKEITFGINVLDNVLHALIPSLEASIVDTNLGFESFKELMELFNNGMELSNLKNKDDIEQQMPNLFPTKEILQFPPTDLMARDEFAWFKDEEFALYGQSQSAITSELIDQEIKGIMSFNEALNQKKIFVLDYHDSLLPYVNKVRQIEGTTLYGSRTLFFLTPQGTLRPVAIELTRPPTDDGKPQWKQVFTPTCSDGTQSWLWTLAKAHVLAHDSGYHQLISHWLRTHCCVEPYIIATNRQLSAMHPINKLMKPYFRFTMMINALAREALINANGIIESSFSTGKYSMEFSSAVYEQEWRFDQQGLPADLISRGMATEDPSAPHGLKLTIEDYPFANDGLILWDAINHWVTDYVYTYYTTEELLKSDNELQSWWEEIRTKGHQDKKDEKWWPKLDTRINLINILTTMIWVTSGHHAAVNFGQYTYAGYFPNRPTIARIKMPSEDPTKEEWNNFVENPEYIGDQIESSWAEDVEVKAAFERFNGRLKKMESVVDLRNEDVRLKNRNGAGILPYQLLKPFSKSGVTSMGVPNSISI
ncbi:Linoleate 13S-lipoxygenase 2-1 chloroplastic [Bienertia sinuspersici]